MSGTRQSALHARTDDHDFLVSVSPLLLAEASETEPSSITCPRSHGSGGSQAPVCLTSGMVSCLSELPFCCERGGKKGRAEAGGKERRW